MLLYCMSIIYEKELQVDTLDQNIVVTNCFSYNIVVRKVYKYYPILIHCNIFHGDFIELPF